MAQQVTCINERGDHHHPHERMIVRSHEGREYLTIEADGIVPDNLLAPPECA